MKTCRATLTMLLGCWMFAWCPSWPARTFWAAPSGQPLASEGSSPPGAAFKCEGTKNRRHMQTAGT
eukprot:1160885-Pelagomonas_calceolata.AAC.6